MVKIKEEEQTPLSFLDRLLPEERDSNLHFGDVRFWKHLEFIDVRQVYRTTSLEYRSLKMMFFEALFYAIFLFLLTGYLLTISSGGGPGGLYQARRAQLNFWGGCSGQAGYEVCSSDAIGDIPSLFDWLRNDLVPRAFQDVDLIPSVVMSSSVFRLQVGVGAWAPRFVGDTHSSVLIGNIRLRQLRVQYNKECTIPLNLQVVQKDCFGTYSDLAQSRMAWNPSWTPSYLNQYYKWWPANVTNQRSISGKHANYPGDGFVFDLPMNKSGAQVRLQELEGWSWLDQRSRALVIEFNTMNPNVNILVNTRILFELPATGGVVVKREAVAFQMIRANFPLMATDATTTQFTYLIGTFALHLMFLVYCSFLLARNGLVQYFSYFWSWVDFVIILNFFGLTFINLQVFVQWAQQPNLQPQVLVDPEMFYPIGFVADTLDRATGLLAAQSVLAWFKLLKYFSLSQIFHPLVRVLERCVTNLIMFGALLFVVLFGFALALFLGWGGERDVFSSLFGSFVAVIVAPAGGVDFSDVFANPSTLSILLIFFYIIIVFFLLGNLFIAACVDTFSVVTYQLAQHYRKVNPIVVFLWTYFNALKGVRLVGKETQDEVGEPDEQEIALSSLPEPIAQRYLAKRRQMQRILYQAEHELEERRLEAERAAKGITVQIVETSPSKTEPTDSQQVLMLQDSNMMQSTIPDPDEFVGDMMVNRVQLQRMLDTDEVLQEICSTNLAVDVIRRFRVEQTNTDPYAAVMKMQAVVAEKLRDLEENGMDLSFDEMDTLRAMSQELHSALTDSQLEWKREILSVLQMSSLLSTALMELTKKLEKVQKTHIEFQRHAITGVK